MYYCGKTTEELIGELVSIDSKDFFDLYVKNEEIWYFNNLGKKESIESYYPKLSSIINEEFSLSNNDFLIVGSAKLGFSLSPRKKFKLFNDQESEHQSDIDIAIISSQLFQECWESLKALKYKTFVNDYPGVSSNIFRGFVNDKNMNQQITLKVRALEMIDNCSMNLRDEFGVIEPINFRIYNSWKDLEKYTIDGINQCKRGQNGI